MSGVSVQGLSFSFSQSSPLALHDVSIELPPGSRTVLVGANGAGKTILLRILAGKRLSNVGQVRVDDVDPFRVGVEGMTYLGTEWVNNPVVRNDISVAHLLSSVGGDAYSDRRDELVEMLDIDLRWHMHAVSDGERRRVQLCMGLLRPWKYLLLDEVTVDLDVLARKELLDFLKKESDERQAIVVYATHIFDGLAEWPTHLAHMSLGNILEIRRVSEFKELSQNSSVGNSSLLELALKWLQEDKKNRGARGQEKRLKWEDLEESDKMDDTVFTKYFKATRGK